MRLRSKLSLLVMSLTLAGYSVPTFAEADSPLLASMRKAGEAKAAMASFPPYLVVSANGEATGYFVEVVNLALKGMGAPALSPTLTSWDAMIPGLQARKFDLINAGMTITEARCKAVVFSAPIFVSQDALFLLPGNPKHLTGYSQIARTPEVKLAVLTGASQQAYALKQGIKPEQLVGVPDIQAGVSTVIGGRADAFAAGRFSIADPEQKGLELVVDKETPLTGAGVAFRKEDAEFRNAFNQQLNLLRTNGTMQQLYSVKYRVPNWDELAGLTKAGDVARSCD